MPGKELGNGGKTLGSAVGKPEGIRGGNVLGSTNGRTVGNVCGPASLRGAAPPSIGVRGPGPGGPGGTEGGEGGAGRAWSSGVITASLGSGGGFGGGVGSGSVCVWGTSKTATAPAAASPQSKSASKRPTGRRRRCTTIRPGGPCGVPPPGPAMIGAAAGSVEPRDENS